MKITGSQIRAGRALARLSAMELADLARVGRMTVVRAELTDDVPSTTSANLYAIKVALETKGVVFGDNGMIGYQPKDAQR
jgi:predicted transcriptional regulator